jgi:hypothetical protein
VETGEKRQVVTQVVQAVQEEDPEENAVGSLSGAGAHMCLRGRLRAAYLHLLNRGEDSRRLPIEVMVVP